MESQRFPGKTDFNKKSTKERRIRGQRRRGLRSEDRHISHIQRLPPGEGSDDGDDVAGPSQISRRQDRHPQGLHGREIGLWYAKRQKQRLVKYMQVVTMKSEKAEEIQRMLGDIIDDKEMVKKEIAIRSQCYEETEDSLGKLKPSNEFYESFLRHQAEAKTIEESGMAGRNVPLCDRISRDRNIDEKLWHDARFKSSANFYEMQEYRKRLPVYQKMQEILEIIENHQVVVITGETGCGKTTQVPQFILDSYIRSGNGSLCHIICTQPRRISAISVAERVAEERDETIASGSVGYHIRLENKCPPNRGSIVFCTTGVVLKYLEGDPYLSKASHLILDEIHERSVDSDFLMAVIKDVIAQRHNLKLILMSATLNASRFSRYFGCCPMVHIPGFTYPVKEYYLEDVLEMTGYSLPFRQMKTFQQMFKWRRRRSHIVEKEEEYEARLDSFLDSLRGRYSDRVIDALQNMNENKLDNDLIVELVKYICFTQPSGAILVFLPGWDQIAAVNNTLTEDPFYSRRQHLIIPLHSKMPTVNQRDIFERPQPGVRKIILATNIAETSVTVNDVVFVVDCGKIKVTNFIVANNLATLTPEWVSLANARQRRGRAGRVQPGICYHLYTKFRENFLEDYQLPEIQRTRLEQLCLQIKIMKLGKIKVVASKTIDPPCETALDLAISVLQKLNALDTDENLTPLGYHLAKLPLDPQTGKMILFGAIFGCLDPVLTVAASLSFTDPFHTPLGKEQLVDKIRYKMSEGSKSDHVMLIKAYQGWELARTRGDEFGYCRRNFLSSHTLKMLEKMRCDLAQELYQVNFIRSPRPNFSASNINSDNMKLVRAVICAGLYPNVAKMILQMSPNSDRHKAPRVFTEEDGRIYLHKKSVNCNEQDFESPWLVYYQKLKSTAIFLHDCTMVAPFPLIFFGGKVTFLREEDIELISVDDHIQFHCMDKAAKLIMQLRIQLDNLLRLKISHPGATQWDPKTREGAIIRAIIELITLEEILIVKEMKGSKSCNTSGESQDEEGGYSDHSMKLSRTVAKDNFEELQGTQSEGGYSDDNVTVEEETLENLEEIQSEGGYSDDKAIEEEHFEKLEEIQSEGGYGDDNTIEEEHFEKLEEIQSEGGYSDDKTIEEEHFEKLEEIQSEEECSDDNRTIEEENFEKLDEIPSEGEHTNDNRTIEEEIFEKLQEIQSEEEDSDGNRAIEEANFEKLVDMQSEGEQSDDGDRTIEEENFEKVEEIQVLDEKLSESDCQMGSRPGDIDDEGGEEYECSIDSSITDDDIVEVVCGNAKISSRPDDVLKGEADE